MTKPNDSIFAKPKWFLTGAALGSGLMFYMDPVRGRARRAQVRDRLNRLSHDANRSYEKQLRQVKNNLRGLLAKGQALLQNEMVDDQTLMRRVRAEMGRKVRQAGRVEVGVHEGHVILRGEVAADELEVLVARIRRVRGVKHVEHELKLIERDGDGVRGDGRVYM